MSTNGQPLTPQNAGYFDGVTDVYYALMESPDLMNQAPVYGTPKVAGKNIEVSVTPNYTEHKVYASDVATRREQLTDSYTVRLNLDQLIPARRQELLGRPQTADGVEMVRGCTLPPLVAVLFAATMDDGTEDYWVLYKGRFSEPQNTHHTRNDGESYQHPVIEGVFTRLDGSGNLASVRGSEYVEGQNILKDTTGSTYTNPISLNARPTQGPKFKFTESGQEQTTGDTTNSYTLSFRYRTVPAGAGVVPDGVSGTFNAFLVHPGGSTKLGSGVTLNGPVNDFQTYTATITLTAAQAAAGKLRSIEFSGTNLAPSVGWQLEIADMQLVQGSEAGPWTPAPEDWFESVQQPGEASVLLTGMRCYCSDNPSPGDAVFSPAFSNVRHEYNLTGTKLKNNAVFYLKPFPADPEAVIEYSKIDFVSISTSVLSSGSLMMTLGGGAGVTNTGTLKVTVRKGSASSVYTLHLTFAP